ncbi:unnamed protein product [Auanema sp. JU1783]|nr:unnamed protein product [Auanema sp. JU1783]
MYRSVAFSLLVCLVAVNAADKKAEKVAVKEGAGFYGANVAASAPAPSYNYGQGYNIYQPVSVPAPFALPNYDVNYCTVHASFPLADIERKHRHHRSKRSYGYPAASPVAAPTGGYASYAPIPPYGRPRRFDRQGCRHTAIFSQTACDICCKISSRGFNTNVAEITGALFVFDPENDWDRKKNKDNNEDEEETKAVQCVCCAPKKI